MWVVLKGASTPPLRSTWSVNRGAFVQEAIRQTMRWTDSARVIRQTTAAVQPIESVAVINGAEQELAGPEVHCSRPGVQSRASCMRATDSSCTELEVYMLLFALRGMPPRNLRAARTVTIRRMQPWNPFTR